MTFTVYVALDVGMRPIYVGSTTNMRARLIAHHDESPWIVDAYRLIQHECPDKATMLSEERRLIAKHNPPWNWLSRTTPNPRVKPTRDEARAELDARRSAPDYRDSAEWRVQAEHFERFAAELGLTAAAPSP